MVRFLHSHLGKNMKKISLFISFALFFFTAIANAHGPVRGKMTATATVDAPAEKVWEVISNYDDLSWLPPVKSVTADKGNEEGSVRVITLDNGETITEVLKKYSADKMSYKYKITKMSTVKTIKHAGQDEEIPALPVDNYQGILTVKEKAGKTIVTWVATYYRGYANNNPPAELNEETADEAVTAVLKSGLTSLMKKFDASASDSDVEMKMKR
jgi:mxaD protein